MKKEKPSKTYNKKTGFALVELIISLGVFSIIIFAVMQLFFVSQEATFMGKQKLKASGLLLEYVEELKNIQRSGWDLLPNGRYIIGINGVNLVLQAASGAEDVDNFSRYLLIEDAYRDSQGNLVSSGGTLDQSTKKAKIFTSWGGLHASQLSSEIYLTRFRENFSWMQTTANDFSQGEMDMVKLVNPPVGDGELQLKGGCISTSPESLIYDDQLRNGWRINCSGLSFWKWLICIIIQFFSNSKITTNSTTYTYDSSPYSIKVELKPPGSGTATSWVRIFNFDNVCTLGFRNLHFYAYNPSSSPISFWVTAVYGDWNRKEVVLPPGGWTEITLDYSDIQEGDYEQNLQSLFFSQTRSSSDPTLVFYLDQIQLTGGVGGYFTQGTLISSVLDTMKISAFNRISYNGQLPENTQIGFQAAVSNNSDGPWMFYGPLGLGSPDDLYTVPAGQGIWLGANIGQYFRYKAFLKSTDGKNTPILNDVTINYSP